MTFFYFKTNLMQARLKRIWYAMKYRCSNPKHEMYSYYGGRGIKVCDEWVNSLDTFIEWALSNGYRDDLSIDRKDNSKDYNPKNCRWATWSEQMKNRRSHNPNRKGLKYNTKYSITHKGKTLNADGWAKVLGVSSQCVRNRFNKNPSPEYVLKELFTK